MCKFVSRTVGIKIGKINFLQMLKKGSKLNSILTGSCPKCQNESMYLDKNMLHLTKILKMNENCSHCGLKYQIEPSFFYGAMYVSYGLNVAIGIAAFIISYVLLNASLKVTFISIIASLIISFPLVLRLSRNIYINMFVSYDEDFKQ
ncbi:Protein of unknown function DUF983 [Flavobacteriaceae bacterium]